MLSKCTALLLAIACILSTISPSSAVESETYDSTPQFTFQKTAWSCPEKSNLIKVGFLNYGDLNTPGWSGQIKQSISRLKTECAANIESVNINPLNFKQEIVIAELKKLAERNSLVFATNFVFGPAIQEVSLAFKQVHFALLGAQDAADRDRSNLTSLNLNYEEIGYLAGVTAAITSKTGNVGMLAPLPTDTWSSLGRGFELGAKAINPKTRVSLGYVETNKNSFATALNTEKYAEKSKQILESDIEVIFAVATAFQQLELAKLVRQEENISPKSRFIIGFETDLYSDFCLKNLINCPYILTSLLTRVDRVILDFFSKYVSRANKSAAQNVLESSNNIYGLFEGAMTLSRNGGYIDSYINRIDEALLDIDDEIEAITPSASMSARKLGSKYLLTVESNLQEEVLLVTGTKKGQPNLNFKIKTDERGFGRVVSSKKLGGYTLSIRYGDLKLFSLVVK